MRLSLLHFFDGVSFFRFGQFYDKKTFSFTLTSVCHLFHIPVEVEVGSRKIKVTGPLGTLERCFNHISMDIRMVTGEMLGYSEEEEGAEALNASYIKVDLWWATRKQLACVRTICSHIENLFTGVTQGFTYKLRFVCKCWNELYLFSRISIFMIFHCLLFLLCDITNEQTRIFLSMSRLLETLLKFATFWEKDVYARLNCFLVFHTTEVKT